MRRLEGAVEDEAIGVQSVRAIVSEFSEGAENFDEMSNEDNTHEPDDSDLVRAPMYFSKFQRWKLHLLHHVGRRS